MQRMADVNLEEINLDTHKEDMCSEEKDTKEEDIRSKDSNNKNSSKEDTSNKDITNKAVIADIQNKVKEFKAANAMKENTIKVLTREKENLQHENVKFHNIVEVMKDRVECQVCLILPKQGPVPMLVCGDFWVRRCISMPTRIPGPVSLIFNVAFTVSS